MSTKMNEGILNDIVPVLHFLRSLLNEDEKIDENTEFECTQGNLLRLEMLYEGYDDLQIIKTLRQKLCDYVTTKVRQTAITYYFNCFVG